MGTSCPEGYPSSLDLLEASLVMVFNPLLDWYLQLLSIGIVVERSSCCTQFIGWLGSK